MIIYGVSAKPISNYLSERYDTDFNKTRVELGLEPIQEHWKLDSIEFIDYGNYSIIEREYIKEWQLKFEDEKLYCQYWSSNKSKKVIPHHTKKKTFFIKSIWVWKNKILGEIDSYNKPISDLKYAELMSSYGFVDKKWFNRLDTLETELQKHRMDSLSNFYSICGTGLFDFEVDTIGITKSETDKILKSWNLK